VGRAVAILVLAAIAQGPAAPARWDATPALVAPADAARTAATGLGGAAEAWSDPAAGCFALVQRLRSEAAVDDRRVAVADVHTSLRAALESGGAIITAWGLSRDKDQTRSVAAYSSGPFIGWAHSHAGVDATGILHASTATCFHNDRSPAHCAARCRTFLAGFAQ